MHKVSTLKISTYLIFMTTFLIVSLCCFLDFKYSTNIFIFALILSAINSFLFFYICKNKVFAEKEKTEKDLKNEIQNNAKNLTTMLNNMPVIAYIVDTDFNIKACNTETLNYFDIELGNDGQIQQLSTDIFEGETMEQMKTENEHIIKTKKTVVTERPIKLKNGKQNWFIIRKVPILDTNNNVSKFVVFGRNIDSERAAQRQRETYISTLSHDLKIPTIAQIRALELLVNGNLGEINNEQKEILNLTLDSCYSMYDMLSTILSTYKYENNDVILNYEKISMQELLDDAFSKTGKTLRNKNIQVKVSSKDKFVSVYADKMQMKKAFENLIDFCVANAYNDTIICCEIDKDIVSNSVSISLLYESPYVNPISINNMFEMYTTSAEKFNKVGSSLNLYLAKQIITAHNGIINIETKQSSYSRCNIDLPCINECAVAC